LRYGFLASKVVGPTVETFAEQIILQTIFVAPAHRGDGKRFIVRADEKLTAFLELESAIRFTGMIIRAPD
jgi:hypothetical protein